MFILVKVASLRQRFFHSIAPGGLAGDRRGVVPASGFSFSAQHMWEVIKENRDLDLPAHKVMRPESAQLKFQLIIYIIVDVLDLKLNTGYGSYSAL